MEESIVTAPVAIFKKRGAKGKANIRKRPATPPPASSDSDASSSEDEYGQRIKRQKKAAGVTATSENAPVTGRTALPRTIYTADRAKPITSANDATKQSDWFEEGSTDSLSAKRLLGSTRALVSESQSSDSYKGLANQKSYIQKNPDSAVRSVGPVKAPTNIRTITVTDYAPDVCKDYKQTGFCGFGDNCKYLHSREDYKAGWQLDREWENISKGRKNLGSTVVASADRSKTANDDEDGEEESALDNIPFVCIICKEPYREPVVTRCGHYFCEPCALARYRRDPTCAACGTGTNGVFNSAKRLKKLLERKKERAAKQRQAAIEAGEEVSSEEDGDGEDD